MEVTAGTLGLLCPLHVERTVGADGNVKVVGRQGGNKGNARHFDITQHYGGDIYSAILDDNQRPIDLLENEV